MPRKLKINDRVVYKSTHDGLGVSKDPAENKGYIGKVSNDSAECLVIFDLKREHLHGGEPDVNFPGRCWWIPRRKLDLDEGSTAELKPVSGIEPASTMMARYFEKK